MSHIWRIIDSGPGEAGLNMALDEAIAIMVRRGHAPVTLRFYAWECPSVTLGRFQHVSDIDAEYCSAHGIPVIRRPTGGRAILHADELTYGFSAPVATGPFSHGLLDSYRKIGTAFLLAFTRLGITAKARQHREQRRSLLRSPLCFRTSSYAEILVMDRKLLGSAQRRWRDGLLQQGSLPFRHDMLLTERIFGEEKAREIMDHMITLGEAAPRTGTDRLKQEIVSAFSDTFDVSVTRSGPDQEEYALARELAERKYRQPSWNARR